mmetsp:Transcript_11887/g.35729  ORF Transcript_11887/g.35729 Transcript_11887/m.35729 type:complete len:333 (+) Transcript_11887:240-1238(+)
MMTSIFRKRRIQHGQGQYRSKSTALCRGASYAQVKVLGNLVAPLTMQVGGHISKHNSTRHLDEISETASTHAKSGFSMSRSNGVVLKPAQSKERGLREICFYETMTHRNLLWPDPTAVGRQEQFAGLKPFLCGYHGAVTLDIPCVDSQCYVVLDDCTNHMRRPCALDIKLGTRSTEDDATLGKQRKSLAKYPCQSEFGCRLVGMRVWSRRQNQYLDYSKAWGCSLRDETAICHGLGAFFGGCAEERKRLLIADFGRKLHSLLDWFEQQKKLSFVSSSLLFIYDAEPDSQYFDSELKLIDFTHVQSRDLPDFGCMQGIRSIIRLLRRMLEETP